jgi:biopolymer transport protein ExbB
MELFLNAYHYFRPGGAIMMVIIATSLCMWGLIFDRVFYFRKMSRDDIDLNLALKIVSDSQNTTDAPGICGRLMRRFQRHRTGDAQLDRQLLDQLAMQESPRLRRILHIITVLAAVAPLLGLLGTVTGMVSTFDILSLYGTGNAKALSGGISKALITTQGGLLVGIPGLFMSRLLARRANAIQRRIAVVTMALKRAV